MLIKRLCLFLVCVLLLLGVSTVAGAEVKNTKKADVLKSLSLFKGTDRGYELDQKFTRAQGAVMVLRLFGLETIAIQSNMRSPFKDVKDGHWAARQIAYAFQKNIVYGTSATTFTPDREMTGREFIALTLRALGYVGADPKTVDETSVSTGLLTCDEAKNYTSKAVFLRDDMVVVAYKALTTKVRGTQETLLQKLVDIDKTVPRDAALASGLYQAKQEVQVQKESGDAMDRIENAIKEALGQ